MKIASFNLQQPVHKKEKAREHAKNVAATTIGLVGTNIAYNKLQSEYLKPYVSGLVAGKQKCSPIVPFFNKLGEKLFKNQKLSRAFENFSTVVIKEWITYRHIPKWKFACINPNAAKGLAAMALVAGVATAGILSNFFYQAGKINGKDN